MYFSTMRLAQQYVREMSVQDTIAIGDYEVWQFDNGEIVIIEPGSQASDNDNTIQVGIVRFTLN